MLSTAEIAWMDLKDLGLGTRVSEWDEGVVAACGWSPNVQGKGEGARERERERERERASLGLRTS
jgi:hypothetical protein